MRVYLHVRRKREREKRMTPKLVIRLISISLGSGEGMTFEPLNGMRKKGAQIPRDSQTRKALIHMLGSVCLCVCVCVYNFK